MDFFSPVFFGFFIIVLLLYYYVRGKEQKLIIFLSSSLFIALFSISVLFITYLFILVNYIIARLMDYYHHNTKLRKYLCNTGILLNIGSLIFYKYLIWLLESISQLLSFFNFSLVTPTWNIIIPI